RLRRALEEYSVSGIKTNAALFRRILSEPDFLRGEIHTEWLDDLLARKRSAETLNQHNAVDAAAIAAALWQATQSQKNSSQKSSAPQDSSINASPSRWKQEARRDQLDRLP